MEYLKIGANITLTNLIDSLKSLKKKSVVHHNRLFDSLLSNLRWFASRQIRNFATLAGNIVTGSAISDLSPILMANDAILTVTLISDSKGRRDIPIRQFFKGYRVNDLKNDEILLEITIQLPNNDSTFIKAYKQSKRKDDDIAITNACFRVHDEIERDLTSGVQDIGTLDDTEHALGTRNPHMSALKQTTGVAKYVDDIPKQLGEVYGHLVLSTKSHGLIKNVDLSQALKLDGVHDFISYKDLKNNTYETFVRYEEVFALKEVHFVEQIIGFIVAESKLIAKKAASLVKIEYDELDSILTIDEAIEKNSFFQFDQKIQHGVFDEKTFQIENENELVFEGTCRIETFLFRNSWMPSSSTK